MMRITGGSLVGRRLRAAPRNVRPTADRVRESLFAMLGSRVAGAVVADLFAGSGVMGIEAWSRGAERVVWVERDYRAWRLARENVRSLCGEEAARLVLRAEVTDWLRRGKWGPFDLIFCDPPYEARRLRENTLRIIAAGSMLKSVGRLIVEGPAGEHLEVAGLVVERRRDYGRTVVTVYRAGRQDAGEQP